MSERTRSGGAPASKEQIGGEQTQDRPVDYDPDHAIVFLRAEGLHDADTDPDVDVVVDGDDVEIRLSATLEAVEKIADREMFYATIGSKDLITGDGND